MCSFLQRSESVNCVDEKPSCGIELNGGLPEQLDRLNAIAPDATHIATVFNPKTLQKTVKRLRVEAQARGMTLTASSAEKIEGLERGLARMQSQPIDAFILLFDPEFFDQEKLSAIRRFVEEKNLIFIVPDPYFFDMGGNMIDAPGFRTMGEEAGIIVRRVLGGAPDLLERGLVYPEKKDFTLTPELRERLGIAPAESGN